jgi:hypothetical protein
MGKRDLKKQYKELEVSFVDLISLLDTTPTKKMTPFLVKQFNDWIQYRPNETQEDSEEFLNLKNHFGEPKNELDEIIKRMIYQWAGPKLEIIKDFTNHMENKRLPDNDINNYDNWNAVKLAINDAEMKMDFKDKKNKIEVLHDNGEWYVIKPLSIEASVNYGYGTKWCTSMRKDNTYFHKYAKDGVLLFVINRKNGTKYAFYSSPKEYSVWTASDARVDSMETTIPFDLLIKIKDWTNYKVVGPNYDYFDEEDKWKRPKLKTVTISAEVRERLNQQIEEENIENGLIPLVPPPTEVNENTLTFRADDWEEEYNIAIESAEEERDMPYISLRSDEDEMVGLGHPVHGSLDQNGERTWSNPYPNGPGGGFDMDGLVDESELNDIPDDAIPADEESTQIMGTRTRNYEEPPTQAG